MAVSHDKFEWAEEGGEVGVVRKKMGIDRYLPFRSCGSHTLTLEGNGNGWKLTFCFVELLKWSWT